MKVLVNGEPAHVADGATVSEVLEPLGVSPRRGVAVAIAGEVLPRGEWERRVLGEGERVEIVQAIQGG